MNSDRIVDRIGRASDFEVYSLLRYLHGVFPPVFNEFQVYSQFFPSTLFIQACNRLEKLYSSDPSDGAAAFENDRIWFDGVASDLEAAVPDLDDFGTVFAQMTQIACLIVCYSVQAALGVLSMLEFRRILSNLMLEFLECFGMFREGCEGMGIEYVDRIQKVIEDFIS